MTNVADFDPRTSRQRQLIDVWRVRAQRWRDFGTREFRPGTHQYDECLLAAKAFEDRADELDAALKIDATHTQEEVGN